MVISNTGPLIALAKSGPESARLDKALRGLIKVTPYSASAVGTGSSAGVLALG